MSAIVGTDIHTRYSVTTGAAGNSVAGTANGSLGKYISTTDWVGGAVNDLYDDISSAENAASTADYRCILVYNANGANAMQNVVALPVGRVAGGAVHRHRGGHHGGQRGRFGHGPGVDDRQRDDRPGGGDVHLADHGRGGCGDGHHRDRSGQGPVVPPHGGQHRRPVR